VRTNEQRTAVEARTIEKKARELAVAETSDGGGGGARRTARWTGKAAEDRSRSAPTNGHDRPMLRSTPSYILGERSVVVAGVRACPVQHVGAVNTPESRRRPSSSLLRSVFADMP